MRNMFCLCLISGVVIFTGLILAGCQNITQQDIFDTSATDIIEAKKAVSADFESAREEFYGYLDIEVSSRSSFSADTEKTPSEFTLRDEIIAEAWTAYYTGNTEALTLLLKQKGLYKETQRLITKYNLSTGQKILDKPSGTTDQASRAVGYSFFDTLQDGDVLLCYGGGSSSSASILGLLIPGHWKHAGYWDYSLRNQSYSVLSASNETDSYIINPASAVGRVGYESKEKWIGESAVAALRVKGHTAAKARGAIEYGKTFIGKPFNFFVSRESNDSFYCSKLVWRGWKSQGIDLEYNTWYYWRGTWVTPQDIWDDGDTSFIGGDSW